MTKSTNAVPSAHPVLETRDLTVRFGGHVAVNAVSCAFHAGSLTAIVGPNGAGKTTYFNLISGQIPSTAGEVFMFGENISKLAPPLRTRRGIGRAFQLTNLFPFLTTLENIRIAVQARAGIGLDLWSMWSSHKDLLEKAEYILEQVALTHQRFTVAKALPHGDQR
ncbi:MAG TPA: ATP-binding cassette domain-containing protein, partial [Rhodocyclaceae bacterium]|nr:ATP-binding cassette domain-containing protein [Rhodocyclaceae bacterium]